MPGTEPATTGTRTKSIVLLGVIAAVATAATQLETIRDEWCKYFGLGCAFEVNSAEITVSAGGTPDGRSDLCKSKAPPVCVSPTSKWRKLDINSGKFVARSYNGNYDNGDPKKVDQSETGWFLKSANPNEICVTVFARTGACETLYSVTGKLTAKESVSW